METKEFKIGDVVFTLPEYSDGEPWTIAVVITQREYMDSYYEEYGIYPKQGRGTGSVYLRHIHSNAGICSPVCALRKELVLELSFLNKKANEYLNRAKLKEETEVLFK